MKENRKAYYIETLFDNPIPCKILKITVYDKVSNRKTITAQLLNSGKIITDYQTKFSSKKTTPYKI